LHRSHRPRFSAARFLSIPRRTLRVAWAVVGALGAAQPLRAHVDAAGGPVPPTTWLSWSFEPGVIVPLVLSLWLYVRGLRQLRRATGVPAKLQREALWFAAGWLLLVVALVSPLHPWGRELFAAHMTQHELLMVGAAPLLVLGRPGLVFLWAFSRRNARELLLWNRALGGEWLWRWLTTPLVAWVVHTAALWVWHIPALFTATLTSDFAHALQHASFLGTALVFWQAVFHGPARRMGYGLGVLYLFLTAMQSGALGALITVAATVWYPAYAATAPRWGLAALQDQQLGGLIMWIPSAMVYVVAGLLLFAQWLRSGSPDSRAAAHPQPAPADPLHG
jgi:putative membrane protein